MKILISIAFIISILMMGITSTSAEEISHIRTNLINYDIQDGELAILWLGNHQKGSLEGYASAGFLLKTSNYVIAIDPSSLFIEDVDSLDRLDAIAPAAIPMNNLFVRRGNFECTKIPIAKIAITEGMIAISLSVV